MILVIDNYDSFVYNLVRYLEELDKKTIVYRNDQIDIKTIKSINPTHILISPGPCTPNESGISKEIILKFGKNIPILGVCLGHQCIGDVFGGKTVKAIRPMHGKTCYIKHNESGLFRGTQNPLCVTRYHSLVIDSKTAPDCLEVTAISDEKEIMGVKHKEFPIYGVQFHPEALLTQCGKKILKNFLVK